MDEAAYCNIPQYFLLVVFLSRNVPVHCAHAFIGLYFLSVFIKRKVNIKLLLCKHFLILYIVLKAATEFL
jgi:hypothetical protein